MWWGGAVNTLMSAWTMHEAVECYLKVDLNQLKMHFTNFRATLIKINWTGGYGDAKRGDKVKV